MRVFALSAFAALSLVLAAPSANAASPFALQDGPKVRIAADKEACGAQAMAWCEPLAQGDAQLTARDVSALQTRVLKNFHYVFKADAPWRSFYATAFDNKAWKAHCGGLTFTMVDALVAAGQPTDKIWRAIVIPATRDPQAKRPPVLHMVAIAELEGELYVVGDTNDLSVYPLSQANFVPTMVSQVSGGTRWTRTTAAPPTILAAR